MINFIQHQKQILLVNMSKTKANLQIVLEPWHHEQQHSNAPIPMNSTEMPMLSDFNPQYAKQVEQSQVRTRKYQRSMNKFYQESENKKQSKQTKRNGIINFVRKNQQKCQLNFTHNYSALMNDDLENFIPLNAHPEENIQFRRPSINTTYIGYYDEEPFFVEHSNKFRTQKQAPKNWSHESKRPKTSDFTGSSHYSRENSRRRLSNMQLSDMQNQNQVYDNTAPTLNGHHLQKVLKIKEKLRQKLKRISEKKDEQRNLYINNTMKIQDEKQKNKQIQQNHKFMKKTSSSQICQNGKKKYTKMTIEKAQIKHVDKWKQYLKMQSGKKQKQRIAQKSQEKKPENSFLNLTGFSNKNAYSNNRIDKSFRVIGGAIYK